MTSELHYRRLYRRLRLPEDADIEQLRQHWRRLVARHHPDRRPEDADATARFQALQAAYDALTAHHRQNGRLPLQDRQGGIVAPRGDTVPEPPVTKPAGKPLLVRLLGMTTLTLILAGGLALWWNLPPEPPAASALPKPRHAPAPARLAPHARTRTGSHRRIRPGMSIGDLMEVAGLPDRSTTEAWHYGQSVVWLHDGRVIGWHNDPDSPLPTAPELPLDHRPTDIQPPR